MTMSRFDLLQAVVDRDEQGKEPDAVIAAGPAVPGRSRPLDAWPRHADCKGQGTPEVAASFDCAE